MIGSVVGSRYYGKDASDIANLHSFLIRASQQHTAVVIAINVAKDESNAMCNLEPALAPQTLASLNTALIPVSNWNGVTAALNTIVEHVQRVHRLTKVLFFQSIEIRSTSLQVSRLHSLVVEDGYFVSGAALTGHMSAKSGGGIASQTPWNTFAAWSFPRLVAIGGFPDVANTVTPPGMEEVGAIVEGSSDRTGKSKVVAVVHEFIGRVDWASVSGMERTARHLIKMASKESRAREVLSLSLKAASSRNVSRTFHYECDWISEAFESKS